MKSNFGYTGPCRVRRCGHGFTLIELLAVIVIIGVLASLVFPLVSQARMAAWKAASTSNLRQLFSANSAFATDHGRYVASANRYNTVRWSGKKITGLDSFDPTKGLLSPYLGKSNKVSACPLLLNLLAGQGGDAIRSFEQDGGGYGYNDYIGGAAEQLYTDDLAGLYIAARPGDIPQPSRTVMFTTSAYATSGNGVQGLQEYPFSHPPFWLLARQITSSRPSPSTHFRFNGKALVAWCDGHISSEKMDTRPVGTNPHGGDAERQMLGWFGPDENNGWWNPAYCN